MSNHERRESGSTQFTSSSKTDSFCSSCRRKFERDRTRPTPLQTLSTPLSPPYSEELFTPASYQDQTVVPEGKREYKKPSLDLQGNIGWGSGNNVERGPPTSTRVQRIDGPSSSIEYSPKTCDCFWCSKGKPHMPFYKEVIPIQCLGCGEIFAGYATMVKYI